MRARGLPARRLLPRPAGGTRHPLRARHVRAGFPSYLAGIPLVPVQALEAVGVAILVAIGAALPHRPAGAAFGAYISGYAVLRFGLEELRGDTLRRWWRSLSEAQWTSLVIAVGTAVAAVGGVLAGAALHVAAALGLVVAAPVVSYRRRRDVLGPAHLRELIARFPAAPAQSTAVAETSLGLRMSSGETGGTAHYTLSLAGGRVLSLEAAAALAGALVSSRHRGGAAQLVPGAAGAYHVVVRQPGAVALLAPGAAPLPVEQPVRVQC